MPINEVIAVLGTIAGTVLGAGIQYFNSRKSAKEASKRIFEQRAYDSKFDRIEELHDSLDDCLSQFRKVITQGPMDIDDYGERVREPYDEFTDAFDKAKIYLSPDEREAIEETIEEFNHVRTQLRLWAQDIDDDWPNRPNDYEILSQDELDDSAEEVFIIIRRKLDPEFYENDN